MNKKGVNKFQRGFTLLEILVSISLFAFALILVNSMYSVSQKSYNKGANKGEIIQNSRVSLDRIGRELRQSVNIVTVLPETGDDPLNPPADEIFFQDGHDISQISYLRYYLDGADLRRSLIVYYFPSEPNIYVTYNSVDQYGNPPEESIVEDRIVGEYFSKLEFWASNNLVYISLGLEKNQDTFSVDTSVFVRN
jgi:prepilin-type N-terminal cleavage/methylation domain-containing protein